MVYLISPCQNTGISPFISRGSKEGAKCIGCPMINSKDKSLWIPKGVDLRLRRTNTKVFGGPLQICQLSLNNTISVCHKTGEWRVVNTMKEL